MSTQWASCGRSGSCKQIYNSAPESARSAEPGAPALGGTTPAIKPAYTLCLQEHMKKTVCTFLSTLKKRGWKSFTA